MRRIFLLTLLALALPSCGPAASPPFVTKAAPDKSLDDLLGLMRQRLVMMHDVARWKWAKKAPIEDPDREAALLKNVAERGRGLGLDPEATRAFFAAQIEAAKIIQRADFRRWGMPGSGPQGEAPDLAGVLRPRIDSLNRDLLDALAKAPGKEKIAAAEVRSRAGKLLVGGEIDAEVFETAIQPILPTSSDPAPPEGRGHAGAMRSDK
jgi:chorismate mutase